MSNLFTLTVVIGIIAVFSIALAWAIAHNLREGQQFRAQLNAHLSRLRLHRLLGLMGVEPGRYLHKERIVDVERQMRACEQCGDTARCDQALEDQQPEAVATYCANYEDLETMKEKWSEEHKAV